MQIRQFCTNRAELRSSSGPNLSEKQFASFAALVLPISIQSVYSSQIIVPVVQRIEQGFPKTKAP
jgi:hypothetical protein